MSRIVFRTAVPALVLALTAAACGGDRPATPVAPGPQEPASFVIVSGDNQTGTVGEELPQPLVVQATNATGAPVPGRHVGFVVVDGEGEMFVGGGVTDANGIVKDYWTLGTLIADSQRVEARSVDPATGAKQVFGVFRATPVAGAAASTIKLGPQTNGWQQPVRSLIADSLRVGVVDRFGNRIFRAGVQVQWLASHGGNVSTTNGIITTNAQGVAVTQWRLGSVATPQTLSTSIPGGTPQVMFQATATPQAPYDVRFSADSVYVDALRRIVPFTVKATDAYGNPVSYTLNSLTPTVLLTETVGTATQFRTAVNGTGRIVLTAGPKSDTLVVVVQQKVASIAFRTMPTTIKVGDTMPMNWYTVPRDSNNQPMPAGTGIWTSTNPSVATVTSGGTVTAIAPGTFTILVTKDGVSRETPVITVVPAT